MPESNPEKPLRPAQHQAHQPGREAQMRPRPKSGEDKPAPGPRLRDKRAIITGGDSGIGRAVAIAFAREGADVAIMYLEETDDARKTRELVEQQGRRCLTLAGDIGDQAFCARAVEQLSDQLGRLDILVNNAAEQHPVEDFADIDLATVRRTFDTNILSFFALTKAALRRMSKGACIINTASVTAYRGSKTLVDYASTKAAIVGFTRALALNLADKGIRVNAVAPGPVWTPLIPASFDAKKVQTFGSDVPMGRAGEPEEIAPCYVFLASSDASYMTGQVLHPNGGEIVNA
jgi:NAD(P)-dependent dehydrogenase (short-subunit alcohol dehydrogenase family)